jgi:hypothetical protein
MEHGCQKEVKKWGQLKQKNFPLSYGKYMGVFFFWKHVVSWEVMGSHVKSWKKVGYGLFYSPPLLCKERS